MMPTVMAVQGCVVAFADADERDADRCLTTMERGQYATLASPAQRADYRASRLAAKRALGATARSTDAAGADALPFISVVRRRAARPSVSMPDGDGNGKAPDVMLSLAHRDGHAVAALPRTGQRVGVDVERTAGVVAAHVRYFASADERDRGPSDAAALWALKEAAWKALALGADVPFRALALEFDARAELVALMLYGQRLRARAALLHPWPRHVVAVLVVEGAA